MSRIMNCKICGSDASFFSSSVVLNKYHIRYFQCSYCGFIQTEDPYWLEEAYSDTNNSYDIGIVNRAFINASICERYILRYFNCNSKFVDYGAGYGIMVRRMRDLGFNFFWHDLYCENLFAKQFEADFSGKTQYELITAFEVFEHLENPPLSIEKLLSITDNIIFSTEIIPENNPKPGEWWYYFPLHGQHIAFYKLKSLQVLAETFGLHFTTDFKNIHLLTKKPLPKLSFNERIAIKLPTANSHFRRKLKTQTLLAEDFYIVTGVRFS